MLKEPTSRKLIKFDLVTLPLIEEISKKMDRPLTPIVNEIIRDGLTLEKWQIILKK